MVVIDEAHRLTGQRAELVGFLLSQDSIGRLLLLTATPPNDGFTALVPGIARTNWNPHEMLNWDGTSLFQPTRLQFLRFTRSQLELEFLRLLDELVKMIPSEPKGLFAGELLVRRAQSNLFSLNPILLQLQGSFIEAAADPKSTPTDEPDEDEPSDLWAQIRWPDRALAQRLVSRLVELLDTIDRDSKLDALVSAMHDWERNDPAQPLRVSIFCAHADTASYVAESLSSRWSGPVFCVMGSTPPDERSASFGALSAGSSVIVATDAALEGINLSQVDYAVNYDLPWSPLVLEQRRGRVDRLGRTRPLNFLCFDDGVGVNVHGAATSQV